MERLLRFLPPETAHWVAMTALRLCQWWSFGVLRRRLSAPGRIHFPALPKLRFANRVGLAAGFDKQAEGFAALAQMGFGFLEFGSVTLRAQPGNPKPRIWRYPPELVNALGFNSVGLEPFARNVERYCRRLEGVPLLANLGKNKETRNEDVEGEYEQCWQRLAHHVDGFVVNLSSPNTPGLRDLQTVEFIESLATRIPRGFAVWVKISPDLDEGRIRTIARAVSQNDKYVGIVMGNSSAELARTLVGAERGGLSGPRLRERSVHWVRVIRQELHPEKILIGVGGIDSVAAAQEYRKAGADLVEIYTGFVYQGRRLVRELSTALGNESS